MTSKADDTGVRGGGDRKPITSPLAARTIRTRLTSANVGALEVTELIAFDSITTSEAANDSLTVNGFVGANSITSDPGVAAMMMLTINP